MIREFIALLLTLSMGIIYTSIDVASIFLIYIVLGEFGYTYFSFQTMQYILLFFVLPASFLFHSISSFMQIVIRD